MAIRIRGVEVTSPAPEGEENVEGESTAPAIEKQDSQAKAEFSKLSQGVSGVDDLVLDFDAGQLVGEFGPETGTAFGEEIHGVQQEIADIEKQSAELETRMEQLDEDFVLEFGGGEAGTEVAEKAFEPEKKDDTIAAENQRAIERSDQFRDALNKEWQSFKEQLSNFKDLKNPIPEDSQKAQAAYREARGFYLDKLKEGNDSIEAFSKENGPEAAFTFAEDLGVYVGRIEEQLGELEKQMSRSGLDLGDAAFMSGDELKERLQSIKSFSETLIKKRGGSTEETEELTRAKLQSALDDWGLGFESPKSPQILDESAIEVLKEVIVEEQKRGNEFVVERFNKAVEKASKILDDRRVVEEIKKAA